VIRYRPHADEAIRTRGLAREWVADVVTTPDWTETDPDHPDRMRSYKAIPALGGRILRVVHWLEGDDIVVLTVHPDRDAAKRRPR